MVMIRNKVPIATITMQRVFRNASRNLLGYCGSEEGLLLNYNIWVTYMRTTSLCQMRSQNVKEKQRYGGTK